MRLQQATIATWGKSAALRLPAPLIKAAGLQIGQSVQLESKEDGSIVVRPVVAQPTLDALLAQVTPENMPDEADVFWGQPVGKEVW